MSVDRTRLSGSFAEPLDDLLGLLGIPSHQIIAAVRPHHPIGQIAGIGTGKPGHLARVINDRLSEGALTG